MTKPFKRNTSVVQGMYINGINLQNLGVVCYCVVVVAQLSVAVCPVVISLYIVLCPILDFATVVIDGCFEPLQLPIHETPVRVDDRVGAI